MIKHDKALKWMGSLFFHNQIKQKNTLGITKEGPTDHADKPGTQS